MLAKCTLQSCAVVVALTSRCSSNEHAWTAGALQAALGELTFESEAADRMRGEVRSAQRQVDDLQHQLQQSAEQVQSAQQAQAQAQQLAADASNGTQEQQRIEKQLRVSPQMLTLLPHQSARQQVEGHHGQGIRNYDMMWQQMCLMHSGADSFCAVHCKNDVLGTAGLARSDEMCCSRLAT